MFIFLSLLNLKLDVEFFYVLKNEFKGLDFDAEKRGM